MRIEDIEHRLGDFREVVVELVTNPRVQKRDRLDQAGHHGIVGLVRADTQPAGDLGVPPGKFDALLSNVCELPHVIAQESIAHLPPSLRMTRPVPAAVNDASTCIGSSSIPTCEPRVDHEFQWIERV